ncbi:MAG: hypothetical protein WCQ50_10790 [Spirochaetota bacterium]
MLKTNAWSGRDPKIHLDETRAMAQRGWNTLIQQFQTLGEQYQIKGAPLREWVTQYGVGPLLHSKDAAVRRAMNHVRKALQECIKSREEGGTFRANELAAFKDEYGTNVTDWLFRLTDKSKTAFYGGREPADLEYEPVEFEDVEVVIYDAEGDPVRTHSVSGSAVRDMNNRIELELLPESTEGITEEEWDASEIEFQISRQIESDIPTWDEAVRSSRSL